MRKPVFGFSDLAVQPCEKVARGLKFQILEDKRDCTVYVANIN